MNYFIKMTEIDKITHKKYTCIYKTDGIIYKLVRSAAPVSWKSFSLENIDAKEINRWTKRYTIDVLTDDEAFIELL